jgi:hypothetical protein
MMISLTWGTVIKVAMLIVFSHATKNMIKKLQEKYCPLCKVDAKADSCCK